MTVHGTYSVLALRLTKQGASAEGGSSGLVLSKLNSSNALEFTSQRAAGAGRCAAD